MDKINLTQNYYNGISRGYKELYHQEQIKKINLIKNYLPKENSLLDLGCGDGVLNKFLEKKVNLISFDLSEELLKLNPNKKENKFHGNCENLPFKNNSFEFIFSLTMLQDTKNPTTVLEEIYRVSKNNSNVIISYLNKINNEKQVIRKIEKLFNVIKIIEEEKDKIYILKKI